MKAKGLLIDITQCVGCGACSEACKAENKLPKTSDDPLKDTLSDKTYTIVEKLKSADNEYYVRRLCQHCGDPSCVSVCPVGAFTKKSYGPVLYDESKCIGCRYCMQACPYQVPRYEWESLNPRIQKCIFCSPRLEKGLPTACSEACPTGATKFGDRDDLLKEAQERISNSSGTYYAGIFGDDEVGGTTVIYLSPVPFEKLGFKTTHPKSPLPTLTYEALSKIPTVVSVGGVMMTGFWWLTKRKNEIARERKEKDSRGE